MMHKNPTTKLLCASSDVSCLLAHIQEIKDALSGGVLDEKGYKTIGELLDVAEDDAFCIRDHLTAITST